MRHHLADRKDQVEAAFNQQSVDLNRPIEVQMALGEFAHVLRRHGTQRYHIVEPVMILEEFERHVAEHFADLRFGHRRMGAERR